MPFNRVNNMKSMVLWLLILEKDQEDALEMMKMDPDKALPIRKVPMYIPGLMLIPIPEAGFILGHVDMAFWAVFLYVVGSVIYVIDSFYLWYLVNPAYTDDALNPATYLNAAAGAFFVLNAIICIIDWWMQIQQLSTMNLLYDESLTGGVHISDIPQKMSVYYFYNNLFFLGAAVIYLVQAIWEENEATDLTNCNVTFCGSFWINFWGSMLYFLSSLFACGESWEAYKLRDAQGLPPLRFFTFTFNEVDWFGWGDILYLVISIEAVLQTFLGSFNDADDDVLAPMYLGQNFLFLIDSIAYFIGYMLFIYEIRQTMLTGMVDAKQTGPINLLIGDNFEVDDARHSVSGGDGEYHIHPRSSLTANAEGKVSMKEIRYKLNEARIIRQRRTEDRLSAIVNLSKHLPNARNTFNGTVELSDMHSNGTHSMALNSRPIQQQTSGSSISNGDLSPTGRQRSVSDSAIHNPML